jgi:hypothetical protein
MILPRQPRDKYRESTQKGRGSEGWAAPGYTHSHNTTGLSTADTAAGLAPPEWTAAEEITALPAGADAKSSFAPFHGENTETFAKTGSGQTHGKVFKRRLSAGADATLSARLFPPMRVTEVVAPINATQIAPHSFVYDLGNNFAGASS